MRNADKTTKTKIERDQNRKQRIFVLALSALGLVYVGISHDMIMSVLAGMMLASFSFGLKVAWKV